MPATFDGKTITEVQIHVYRQDHTLLTDDVPDVLRINTSQSIDDCAGSFTLTLKDTSRAARWFYKLPPQTIVYIFVRRQGDRKLYDEIMFAGLVDRDSSGGSVSAESGDTEIEIKGRSFGKLLMTSQIYFSPYATNPKFTQFGWSPDVNLIQGAPESIMSDLLDRFVYHFWDLSTGWDKFLKPIFEPLTLTHPDSAIGTVSSGYAHLSLEPGPIPVYAKMQELITPPFGELFVVRDELHLRPKPWVPDAWDKLRNHQVSDEDLINCHVSQTDYDVATQVMVHGTKMVTENTDFPMLGVWPEAFFSSDTIDPNDEAVRNFIRYGMHKKDFEHCVGALDYTRTQKGVSLASGETDVRDMLGRLAHLYYEWYKRPYKSATFTMKGRLMYVGDAVHAHSERKFPLLNKNGMTVPSDPGQWYLESVDQIIDCTEGGSWTTTLCATESRAYPHDDLDVSKMDLPTLSASP